MLRAGQQESSHISIQSPASHQSDLTTTPPALCQEPGPPSQATSLNTGSEGATALRESHQHHADGEVDRRDLHYVLAPGMNAQASDEVGSGVSTSTARGTKRAHEVDVETDGDGRRPHGKRLTTKEEIALFEICNQHADGFGKRSDICNWWRNVTEEFTRIHGPYSWHSVRRKVEIVTKQRIKFLEEWNNREEGPPAASADKDVMHPRWCTVVDAWLPTWKRWEESEIRRIERRDEEARRRSRAREPRPGPLTGRESIWSFLPQRGTIAGSATTRATSSASPVMGATEGEDVHSTGEAASINQIQLPPGFENMFSSHKRASPPAARVSPSSSSPSWPDTSSAKNVPFSALVETLGKLNNHLDAASRKGDADPRTSPLMSALVQATSELDGRSRSPARETPQPAASVGIARLKEELRQEMQAEMRRGLERDRAMFEEKLDSVQRTQEMILEMLRQEPS